MKGKSTKSALLMSFTSLLLCFAMLIGCTFAWFTDSVTSGINQIKAGNLDVELYHAVGAVSDTSEKVAENTVLFNVEHWEPGVVAYENFLVKNVGTLALKYQLAMTVGDFNKTDPDGHTLKEVLKVAVVPGGFTGTTRADAEALDGYTTLEQFSTGSNGALLPGAAGDTFGVVIYWEPNVQDDNLYNLNNSKKAVPSNKFGDTELGIELGIKLLASQLEHESDSFGNDYDGDASYSESVETTIKAGKDTVFFSAVTPSNKNGNQTKVTVPKEVKEFVEASGQTSSLTVEATPAVAANNTFTISNNGAVGAIDLTVKVNNTVVSEFKDSVGAAIPVTVETYVARNLTNVQLAFGDSETWGKVDTEAEVAAGKFFYDMTTGKLVFGTIHFSTFVLGADEVAYVEDSNMAYKSLPEALEDTSLTDGGVLVALKPIANPTESARDTRYVYFNGREKTITFDTNGNDVTGYELCVKDGSTLVLTGEGTITLADEEPICIYKGSLVMAGVTITSDVEWSGNILFANYNEDESAETYTLTVADGTENTVTNGGYGGSAIMALAWDGDVDLSIKGESAHTGKLIVSTSESYTSGVFRCYQGGATGYITMEDFYIDCTAADNNMSDGTGEYLIRNLTGGFSADVTEWCEEGYCTAFDESVGRYVMEPLTEDAANFKVVKQDGSVAYLAGSIYQAMSKATENSTIVLLKDINVTDEAWNAPGVGAERFTIDMNGKTISGKEVSIEHKSVQNPDNVSAPVYVTIKNGTIESEFDFSTYTYATIEKVNFVNTGSSYDRGLYLNSNINRSTYDWAAEGTNSLTLTDCVFTDKNIKISTANEGQKVDLTLTGCTFGKTMSSNDDVIDINYYMYGAITLDNCKFNCNFNNSYTYMLDVGSTSSSNGNHPVTLNLKNVEMNATGSATKPVNNGIATVTETGTNIYTVGGTAVNYDGTAITQ